MAALPEPLQEDEILTRAAQGDREAFGLLYERYVERIFNYVYYRTGNLDDAEDLTARVFQRAMNHIGNYTDRGVPFSAWLYRIAHNIIIDDARQQQRRPTGELHDGLSLPSEADPDYLVGRKLENERIRRALDQLTPEQKEVIILRFGEGMTAPQVAHILGKSEEAVRALQRRGLANLRRLLSPIAVTEHEP